LIRLLVDTSAWYALADAQERDHEAVRAVLAAHRGRLVTSDYVFDETITLVRKRRGWEKAHRLGAELRTGRAAVLVHVTPADLDAAWSLFERRPDQRLSLTDCTSFVLMERLKLAAAVTLDQDFRALGLATLP
jgi:predicted nucleic acid-binding protein